MKKVVWFTLMKDHGNGLGKTHKNNKHSKRKKKEKERNKERKKMRLPKQT